MTVIKQVTLKLRTSVSRRNISTKVATYMIAAKLLKKLLSNKTMSIHIAIMCHGLILVHICSSNDIRNDACASNDLHAILFLFVHP